MRIFLSALTLYTYKNDDDRIKLNLEEIEKFREGLEFAGEIDKGVVFLQYSPEKMRDILEDLTPRERKSYENLLEEIQGFKNVVTDLTDFSATYSVVEDVLVDFFGAHIYEENISVLANLSCGHKMGAFAIYLAIMQVIHRKEFYSYFTRRGRKGIDVDVFHAEKGIIEKLPVMNYEGEETREWDSYLLLLKEPMELGEFRKRILDDQDKVIMYLKRMGYMEMRNNTLYLTTRGRTLVELLEKID